MIHMGKRLRALASLVQTGRGLIDVGTDHGYLPVMLAQAGYSGTLFASDIHPKPLEAARMTAAAAGLNNRIHFLCCDGLTLCPPEEIDTIVIAGMGGDMIVKILDDAEWCLDSRYRMILQPATKQEVLRYWLVCNGFSIECETLTEEAGILYQILTVRYGCNMKLSDAELFAGRRCLCTDLVLYDRQIRLLSERFDKAMDGMKHGGETPRLALYREIRQELRELGGKEK